MPQKLFTVYLTEDSEEDRAIQDLLAEMASQPSGAPSSLLFLADDPLRDSPIIRRLIGGRSRITAVPGTASACT